MTDPKNYPKGVYRVGGKRPFDHFHPGGKLPYWFGDVPDYVAPKGGLRHSIMDKEPAGPLTQEVFENFIKEQLAKPRPRTVIITIDELRVVYREYGKEELIKLLLAGDFTRHGAEEFITKFIEE